MYSKMKRFNCFSVGMLMLTLVSCGEDFLNLVPTSSLTSGSFFKTEDHFQQALSGTYATLRGLTARQGYLMCEMRSDNTHYTLYEQDRGTHIMYREHIADFTNDQQNQWSNEMYYACYAGIARANTILDRIDAAGFAETSKTRIKGEASFIRALFYFYLVRFYGDVPLYLHEVQTAEQSYVARSPLNDVYTQIIADATFAMNNLANPSFPQNGRGTKGSAIMLLAKVYMTMPARDYAAAEQHLRDITQMGYELLPVYADVFALANKNSKESIFEIQYQQGDQGQQSNWIYFFAPKTSNGSVIFGNPASTMLTGGWNVPNQEVVDLYEDGDTRLNASIGVAEGTGGVNNFIPTAVKDPYQYVQTTDTFFYFVRKVHHAHARQENTDDNWPIFRYSDALLSLAECLVYQNKAQGEADGFLKEVRVRAGGSLPALTATEDNLALERRRELAFENHRWFDLVRTGKAVEVMTAYGLRQKEKYSYLKDDKATYQVNTEKLIFPIPYMELQLNTQLTQNSGY
jgi:hypothetical protein